MKKIIPNVWRYVAIGLASFVLIAAFNLFYCSTISNEVDRFPDVLIEIRGTSID